MLQVTHPPLPVNWLGGCGCGLASSGAMQNGQPGQGRLARILDSVCVFVTILVSGDRGCWRWCWRRAALVLCHVLFPPAHESAGNKFCQRRIPRIRKPSACSTQRRRRSLCDHARSLASFRVWARRLRIGTLGRSAETASCQSSRIDKSFAPDMATRILRSRIAKQREPWAKMDLRSRESGARRISRESRRLALSRRDRLHRSRMSSRLAARTPVARFAARSAILN